jgi:phosphatidylglycerophosphate synthase
MRSANPPVHLESRGIHLSAPRIGPRQMLVAANALSLSRGVAAVGIFVMSLAGASAAAMLAVASVMWLTDAVDGWVARRGHRRGASARTDGAALDPLMDDLAFIGGFLVLLSAGVVPLWFVAALLASRVIFALVRITGLAYKEPFARSELVTKISGAVLAIGQLLLLAHLAFPDSLVGGAGLVTVVIAVMTLTTTYSLICFALWKHGHVLKRLLTAAPY